jgi:hypothetical protein
MKSLACTFGRHRWTTHTEHGDEYKVCSACGKIPKDPRGGPKGSRLDSEPYIGPGGP